MSFCLRKFEIPRWRALAWCACVAGAVGAANAQECRTLVSTTSLAAFSGKTIGSITIETREPTPLPMAASMLDRLHVRTREQTVQRLLLLHAGEPIDTLRVAESLRRLRQLRYLTDVAIRGQDCGYGPVDLTVITQDLWSVKPSLQVRSASQAFAVTERNVLGTGREASVGIRSDEYGVRPSMSLRDPWFLGRDLSLDLTTSGDGERGARAAILEQREHSILDRVGWQARIGSSAFDADENAGGNGMTFVSVRRLNGEALLSRRISVSEGGVYHIVAGGMFDQLAWETPADGPAVPFRRFAGASLGLRRRSVSYDTATWILPRRALTDVPLSLEFDALVSAGHDIATDAPALHTDLWAGRMWLLDRTSLLVVDAWASGFVSRSVWSAATVRGAVQMQRAAPRGLWLLRTGYERSFNPDPDVRAPVITDPTQRALGSGARRSLNAVTASLERTMHVRNLTRSYTLDAGAFVAASHRDSAAVAAVGLGLRLAPARLGRATARLDFAVPVLRSGDVNRRPYVSIGITPWLEQDRARDGRRTR